MLRVTKVPERYNPMIKESYCQIEQCHNIITQTIKTENKLTYEREEAKILLMTMTAFRD